MKKIVMLLTIVLGFLGLFIFTAPASAVPDFAAKLQTDQALGHSAWPSLNAMGRNVKESGYNLGSIGIKPMFIVKGYVFNKKKDKDEQLRGMHEWEAIIAGRVAEDVSVFLEIEGEDETDFAPALETGVIGFHSMKYLNLQLGYGPILFADPYDTISNSRRMTRNDKSGVLGKELVEGRQFASISGRMIDKVFYIAAVGGALGNKEGENPSISAGRIAVDVLPGVMIGGFGIEKKVKGVDAQIEIASITLRGVRTEVGESDNYSIESTYVYARCPMPVVPTVRFDKMDKGDKTQTELTSNLSVYIRKNVKIGGEYWTTLNPSGEKDNHRVTAMMQLAF